MQSFPIKSIKDLENISSAAKWQYFEKLVAFVFEQNGFETRTGVIIKDGYGIKRQIDVLARKYGVIYVVECKKWKGKQRSLKAAVAKHLERCGLYEHLYGDCLPVIVTLLDDALEVEGVPIIPIMKLNNFLNE